MPSTKRKAATISQAASPPSASPPPSPRAAGGRPPQAALPFTGMATSPGRDIPDDLWARIVAFAMGCQGDLARLSQVCREWTSVMHGELAEESLAFVPVVLSAGRWLEVCAQVSRRSGLARLTLTGVVGDEHLEAAASLGTLRSLDLRGGDDLEHDVTDTGVQLLSSLTKLETLNLMGCVAVTDAGVQSMGLLTNLETLDLYGCSAVTDVGVGSVCSLTNLQTLNLWGCSAVTDAGVHSVAALTNLRKLNLQGCSAVTDAGVLPLASLTNLCWLHTWGTQVSAQAKQTLRAAIPGLRVL